MYKLPQAAAFGVEVKHKIGDDNKQHPPAW